MRKYVIGILVALVFVAYSMVLRGQRSGPVVAPSSLSSNTAPTSTSPAPTTTQATTYKDGTYTGPVENAFYGDVQVSATIANGKITSVDFLQAPDENPNSIYINKQADPYLKQEAIKAQSADVSSITGATFTSQAFKQSLQSALSKAQA